MKKHSEAGHGAAHEKGEGPAMEAYENASGKDPKSVATRAAAMKFLAKRKKGYKKISPKKRAKLPAGFKKKRA